jgi:flagellar biosynthesis/type III secretory pathway protein FliH
LSGEMIENLRFDFHLSRSAKKNRESRGQIAPHQSEPTPSATAAVSSSPPPPPPSVLPPAPFAPAAAAVAEDVGEDEARASSAVSTPPPERNASYTGSFCHHTHSTEHRAQRAGNMESNTQSTRSRYFEERDEGSKQGSKQASKQGKKQARTQERKSARKESYRSALCEVVEVLLLTADAVLIAQHCLQLILPREATCEKRHSCFECFPYVCPEPVLTKRIVSSIKMAQKRRVRTQR